MALSWYNIIPEGVYLITSVTSKTTADFDSSFGKKNYQKVQSKLMFGYQVEVFDQKTLSSRVKIFLKYIKQI